MTVCSMSVSDCNTHLWTSQQLNTDSVPLERHVGIIRRFHHHLVTNFRHWSFHTTANRHYLNTASYSWLFNWPIQSRQYKSGWVFQSFSSVINDKTVHCVYTQYYLIWLHPSSENICYNTLQIRRTLCTDWLSKGFTSHSTQNNFRDILPS